MDNALLDARDVARLLGLSANTVHRRTADGTLPRPIRIGRSKRWSLQALDSWIVAENEAIQTGKRRGKNGRK